MTGTGQHRRREFIGALALGLSLSAGVGTSLAQAPTYTVLHQFSGADGISPNSLIRDWAGNLYGTTNGGGLLNPACAQFGCGVVFKLDPAGKFTTLHAFSGPDGNRPAGLVRDLSGNLYGSTLTGGSGIAPCEANCGVVFKLEPGGQFTVLHSFSFWDGQQPHNLIRDWAGNLYGVTTYGGPFGCVEGYFELGCGVIFKVDPTGRETVLYNFPGGPRHPDSGLVVDRAGNAYGTTLTGAIFKLQPNGNVTVLSSSAPGGGGSDSLILDFAGNLYGTTSQGGISNPACSQGSCGVVFKVDPTGKGTVLYSFTGGADGGNPGGGLIGDLAGNLYGTTSVGGNSNPACFNGTCGAVFKLDPSGRLTVLYRFAGGADGQNGGLQLLDWAGNFYGTADGGSVGPSCGQFGCGVVFKLKP